MLLSQAEVRELIAESSGITIDTDDVTISFNKKELSFPPDDIFNTRAAGKLSTRALIDVCQCKYWILWDVSLYSHACEWSLFLPLLQVEFHLIFTHFIEIPEYTFDFSR